MFYSTLWSHTIIILIQHHSHFTAEETESQHVSAVPKATYLMAKSSFEPDLQHCLLNYTFIIMLISVIHPVEEEEVGRKE